MKVNAVFLGVLWVLDFAHVMTLWDERYFRRVLHHFQRLSYTKHRDPWVVDVYVAPDQRARLFGTDHVQGVQDTCIEQLPTASWMGGVRSQRCMRYYDTMSDEERQGHLRVLGELLLQNDDRVAPYRLLSNHSRDSMFVIDYGSDGDFDWHYDTEDPAFARLLVGDGDGMVFEYVAANGSIVVLPGTSAVLIRGTTTFHRARRVSEGGRRVFAFQLSSTPLPSSSLPKSLCNTLASCTLSKLATTFLPYVLLCRLLRRTVASVVSVPTWVIVHLLLLPLHRYSLRTTLLYLFFLRLHLPSFAEAGMMVAFLSVMDDHPLEKK